MGERGRPNVCVNPRPLLGPTTAEVTLADRRVTVWIHWRVTLGISFTREIVAATPSLSKAAGQRRRFFLKF